MKEHSNAAKSVERADFRAQIVQAVLQARVEAREAEARARAQVEAAAEAHVAAERQQIEMRTVNAPPRIVRRERPADPRLARRGPQIQDNDVVRGANIDRPHEEIPHRNNILHIIRPRLEPDGRTRHPNFFLRENRGGLQIPEQFAAMNFNNGEEHNGQQNDEEDQPSGDNQNI